MAKLTPANEAMERAKARKEGRVYQPPGEAKRWRPTGPFVKPADPFRDAIKAGDVLIEDIPVGTKFDHLFTNVPETQWREAGPQDLDAARAIMRGVAYVGPDELKQQKAEDASDRELEREIRKMEREAARERAHERVNGVEPLPGRNDDGMSHTEADERKFERLTRGSEDDAQRILGVRVGSGGKIEDADQGPAQVGRELTRKDVLSSVVRPGEDD
ncbi:MAG TPA: hypothetical protein VM285_12425 [Polyangia bacterium]|nr:hypothetical protein [Polyangia bacterium]